MYSPEQILESYQLTYTDLVPITSGIIHHTWRAHTNRGAVIVQQVSPIFKLAVMEDIATVLDFLQRNGCTTMEILRTPTGELSIPDEDRFWRIFTCIEGRVFETVTDQGITYEAGNILGSYHRILSGLTYSFKHERPIKHNISLYVQKYQAAIAENTNPDIAALIPTVNLLPTLDLPATLRRCVLHGDPKISNIVFTAKAPHRAITMIDWDDVGKQYNVLFELGSAFRSWCQTAEDDPRNAFSLERFAAALKGYAAGSQNFLLPEEWELLPQTLKLIPLELASRFIRDYFEDSYFRWDTTRYPSRKAHNLARAQGQVALYQDICNKEKGVQNALTSRWPV